MDNPAFCTDESCLVTGAGSTSVAASVEVATTGGEATGDGTSTSTTTSSTLETTDSGVTTLGGGEGPTSAATTGDVTSSTGEDAQSCGLGAFGAATMYGHRFIGATPQQCADIEGRNFLIVGSEGDMAKAIPCTADPALGCAFCDPGRSLLFSFHTPEPVLNIDVTPCVYLTAAGATPTDNDGPCRYDEMVIWADKTFNPANSPPVAIFGHGTLATPPTLALVAGADVTVSASPLGTACSCADPISCCPEQARDYRLRFSTAEIVELSAGEHGALELAGAPYEAYVGQAQHYGVCGDEAAFDWWLIRL